LVSLSVAIGTQLVAQAGVFQKLARAKLMLVGDKHAAWQHAERALKHAHVLVKDHRTDAGAFQQRNRRRHQNCVIRTDQFTHAISVCSREQNMSSASQPRRLLPTAPRIKFALEPIYRTCRTSIAFLCSLYSQCREMHFGRRPSV